MSRAESVEPGESDAIDGEVVNAVGVGSIGSEIDVEQLADDMPLDTEYRPDMSGCLTRTDSGVVLAWRSGSYTVRGSDSVESCRMLRERWLGALAGLDVPHDAEDAYFEMCNVVVLADLNQPINLPPVPIALGLEETEYEPELFPGLFWKRNEATVIVFSSGSVVSVGTDSPEKARQSIRDLATALSDMGMLDE